MKPQPDTHTDQPHRPPPTNWYPSAEVDALDAVPPPRPRAAREHAPPRVHARSHTIALAYGHHTIACQAAAFLLVLAAALMHRSASFGTGGNSYQLAGLLAMASALVLVFIARRRLRSTLMSGYLRDGLGSCDARRRAKQDVERALSGTFRGDDVSSQGVGLGDLSGNENSVVATARVPRRP